MLRIGTLLLAGGLLVSLGASAALQEGEKEEAFQKATGLMEEGEWKKAIKAIKSYKRNFAKTPEEKEEAKKLLGRAEGEKDLAGIQQKYRRNSKLKAAVKSTRKFLKGYDGDDDLRGRAEEFSEALRSEYIAEIADFEDDDWIERNQSSGVSAITDEKMVRHGEQAARWKTGVGSSWLDVTPSVTDWTPYTYFCFWIYSYKKPDRPGYILIRPGTDGWSHGFEYVYPIDFKGWRDVRIPFAGKRGFARSGAGVWSDIQEVDFYHPSYAGVPVDVVLDDIRLEKAIK